MNNIIENIEKQLQGFIPPEEQRSMALWLLEETTGLSRTDILCGKGTKIIPETETAIARLKQHEPIQYIFGHTDWRGMLLEVNPAVLIPRPETSELVDWVLEDNPNNTCSLLDAGTGSGCIAIAIKKVRPQWQVTALDISPKALAVAQRNGMKQEVDIIWQEADMLHLPNSLHADILVSNPPYILKSEQVTMDDNVLWHEPHQALFVEDNDPLRFYRALAQQHLAPRLYFEINPLMVTPMQEMLHKEGYTTLTVRHDMEGKERFIRATR